MNKEQLKKVKSVLKRDIPFLKVNDEDLLKINTIKELRLYLENKLIKAVI